MWRRLVWLAGTLVMILVLALGAGLWRDATRTIRPPWYTHRTPEQGLVPRDGDWLAEKGLLGKIHDPGQDFGYAFESVEFSAADGSTLRGWFVPGDPDAVAGIVTVHGAGVDRRDFLRHLPVFHVAGYPVLLFDCREHGISDGAARGASFGVREHEDVSSAVAYMKEARGLQRVGVVGTSQGGTSVILAAAADAAIDAVISENPFASVPEMLENVVPQLLGESPSKSELAALIAVIEWRTGSGNLELPLEAAARIAPRPLLLMHGTKDAIIPYSHSERLHAVAPGSELWIAEDAGHAALFNRYPEEWSRRVLGFLAGSIGPAVHRANSPGSGS
jgi:pimeloyl-ACP methyl ester carboxylesterase